MRQLADIVQKPSAKWIDFLYGPFFRIIGLFYRTYCANRKRLADFKANHNVAAVIQVLAVLVLVGWIMIWIFTPDENRNRLTEEFENSVGGFDSIFNR